MPFRQIDFFCDRQFALSEGACLVKDDVADLKCSLDCRRRSKDDTMLCYDNPDITTTMGTARPIAQGQETIRTEIAYVTVFTTARPPFLMSHRDANGNPDRKSYDCEGQNNWHKVAGDIVHEFLGFLFRELCFVHHCCNRAYRVIIIRARNQCAS